MDYEKRYKEALEQAKKELAQSGPDSESARQIKRFFPELAESEDERIRKFIQNELVCLRASEDKGSERYNELTSAIAYLEKQKETHYTKRNALFDKCVAECDPEIMQRVSNEIDEMIGKEQKSERIDIAKMVAKYGATDEYVEGEYKGKPINCMIRAYEQGIRDTLLKVKEQKPADWSEEDEKMSSYIVAALDAYFRNRKKRNNTDGQEELEKAVNWIHNRFKSLRPQPLKEIYQAAKHDLAIKFMNYLDENRPEGKMSLSYGECEDIDKAFKENDWAKIMRYIEKYSSHWKPSEEQIYSLGTVVKGYDECTVGSVGYNLKELYEQLKKL